MGFFSNLFGTAPQPLLENLASLGLDMHSHLIPGIDDGSKSMEESLFLIGKLKEIGFKKIITSPHIMAGGYNNTPAIILKGRDEVRKALADNHIEIEFDAFAEYYLDETIHQKMKDGLITVGDNYLLTELSYYTKSFNTTSYFYALRSAGYKVILAHPERYPYYWEDSLENYKELKDMGLLFQLNITSLSGVYGKGAKVMAERMIDEGMIDFVSTDLHNERHFNFVLESLKSPHLVKILESGKLKNNLLF